MQNVLSFVMLNGTAGTQVSYLAPVARTACLILDTEVACSHRPSHKVNEKLVTFSQL